MRTIAEYLALPYHDRIVRSKTTGGEPSWFATVDELQGLTTSSLTLDDMEAQLEDAKQAWFEAAIELGREIPEPQEEDHSVPEYSGRLGLRIAKDLHRAAVERAALEGISLTQFVSNVLAGAVAYGSPPSAIGGLRGAMNIGYGMGPTMLDKGAIMFAAGLTEGVRRSGDSKLGIHAGPGGSAGETSVRDIGLGGESMGAKWLVDTNPFVDAILANYRLVPDGKGGYEFVAIDTESDVKGSVHGR